MSHRRYLRASRASGSTHAKIERMLRKPPTRTPARFDPLADYRPAIGTINRIEFPTFTKGRADD